jgi:beta-mannosidase
VTRRTEDLGGTEWRFGPVTPKPLNARLDDRAEVEEWLPATVPGNVRTDLLAAGRIEDPFYGTNNEQSQWVDAHDWWYVRPLHLNLAPGQRAFLSFEGIDYISAVYLDDKELGQHEGMFSRQVCEITNLERPQRSELAVRIWGSDSLPQRELSWWESLWSPLAKALRHGREAFPARSATLKCQMGFGWDFAPRLRTMGLWDDVALFVTRSVFLRDAWIKAHPENNGAHVTVLLTIDSDTAQEVLARLEVRSREGFGSQVWHQGFPLRLNGGQQTTDVEFALPDARLWQPWDRGEPCLYDLTVQIERDGEVLDSLTESFGVRSVEMARNPGTPKGNEDWTVVLNGTPEFIRGANWVPLDALPGRLSRADYEGIITMAREAGVNLLRVWGGGLREKKAFYDLCDERGILVWQEFPLACLLLGHLPRSASFRGLLAREGRSIVRQLRNHPSIVLWCGGNEFSYRRNRRLVDSLEEIVRTEDGTRPCRKTSPRGGAIHNWLVWHGKAPAREYLRDHPQFITEFGLQAVPDLSSLSRFLPADELYPPGAGWRYHCAQLDKLQRYVDPLSPHGLQEWIEASQRAQAHALQIAIEHFRRRKYRTSGTVVWQLNDAWPAISWSLIDYYRQPKRAYERLRSLYHPILICLEFPLGQYRRGDLFRARVWAINDLQTDMPDCVLHMRLDGVSLFSGRVSLPPDSSQPVTWVEHLLTQDPGQLEITLRQGEKVFCTNAYDLRYYDPTSTGRLDRLYARVARWLLE